MGLLSRLPFMLQSQSPLAGLGQPNMGAIPGVVPFAPNQQPEGQGMGPALSMSPPNKPQAPGQGMLGGLQGVMGRLNTAVESPLFQMGISMLGAGSDGRGWSGFGEDLRSIGQQQMQRNALQNEMRRQKSQDAREETVFGRQQTEWQRADQTRQAWEAAVNAEQDPQRRAMLRAMGPDGYGQFMAAESNRAFQAEQAELDRRNALNVAGMRLTGANRPEGASPYWQRPSGRDQMMLQDYEGAVQNGRAALIGLDRLERLFGEMIQRDAQGRPLPASMRMSMSRLMQINPEARAAYEQIQSQVWPLVLQNLEGLAPVTEVELGQALARTVNADMTPEAAVAEIRRMRMESQRAVDLGLRAYDFVNEAGSLNTGRNAAGQNWIEYSGQAFDDARARQQQDLYAQNRQRAPAAPRVGEVRNGYRYVGGDPSARSSWVRVNGGGADTYRRPDMPAGGARRG